MEQLKEIVDSIALPSLTLTYEELLNEIHSKRMPFDGCVSKERLALSVLLDRLKSVDDVLTLYKWHSGIREARLHLKRKILVDIVKQRCIARV